VSGIESAILYLGYSCCLSPMRRNSVLEVLSVRRFAVIQEEMIVLQSVKKVSDVRKKIRCIEREKIMCHQHKDGGLMIEKR